MAVDWDADGMRKWRENAIKEQQDCFDLLGTPTWREFEPSRYVELKRQIGFALFGLPEELASANLNDNTGYRNEKLKDINEIFGIILKCTKNNTSPNNVCVSFLYLSGKTRDACITVPVIRTQQFDKALQQNNDLFIDTCGRVYKGWQVYLENNKLPDCVFCYPKNGMYFAVNGAVQVEFGISPAGRTGAKILQGLDIGGSILNVGAAGTLIAGMAFPLAMPVVAGAVGVSMLSGAYSAGRNIETLVDRNQRQQSIGLDNAESRNCWLGIGGGVLAIVSGPKMLADFKTAQAGVTNVQAGFESAQANAEMPLAAQFAMNSVAVGSCVLNGLAVCNGLWNIIDKARKEEKITPLDVFQLTSAVLFFTNSVISARQAMSLGNNMGKNSSGEIVAYIKAWKDLISGAYSKVSGVTGGFLNILYRTAIKIAPYYTMGRFILENNPKVVDLLHEFWESWKKEMAEVVDVICGAFGVKDWSELVKKLRTAIEYGHIRAIASILIAEYMSLVDFVSRAMPSDTTQASSDNSAAGVTSDGPKSVVDGETENYEFYYDEIASIFVKFVDRQKFINPADFCEYMAFICKFVKSQLQERKSRYEKSWDMVKRLKPDVEKEDFKKEYGISGNPYNHFLQEVFNAFKNEEQDMFTLLHLTYEKQKPGTSVHGQVSFDGDGVRFYPFDSMCGLANNGMLSEQQYRDLAAKLTGQHADTDSINISDSGDTAVIQVNAAANVIMVQCWSEDGKVSGIAAVLHTPLGTECHHAAVTKDVVPNC